MLFLYPPGIRDFDSVTSSPLTDAFNDVMIEELNGRHDLSFNYPIDKLEEINYEFKDFSIIVADSPKSGRQPFFITEVDKKEEYIHVEAKHVFFLLDIFNMDYVDCSGDPTFVLGVINSAIIDKDKFPLNLYSNMNTRVDLETEEKTCMMDTLCKGQDSLLSQLRGELLRNGYNVGFVKNIGRKTDYILAQRKNIEDVSIKLDYTKIVTKIHTEMTIDRKKFIPEKIPGSSRVYDINSVPESDRTSYRIRIFDGARGGAITENAGAFMLFDANGHFVLSNSQTGTPASIEMWKKKKEDLQKKIDNYDSKKTDKQQKKVNDYVKKVQVSEQELKQNTATYNKTKKESDRKRVESSKRTLRQNKEILERARQDLAKIGTDLAKWKKELSEIPTVILGERYYKALLPPGEYFSVMKSAPNGYIHNQDVHHFTIGYGGGEYVDDWYVNPESYEEDQTYRIYASVDSPIIGAYPYVFHAYEELKDTDEKFDKDNFAVWSTTQPWVLDEEATEQKMREWAEKIFENERPDLPLETLSFSLGDEVLESGLGLGDSATVVYENYGLYKNHPLVTIEWSPMQLKYLKMEFGDKPGSFTADLQSQLNSGLNGLQKQFENYREQTNNDISMKIQTEGDRLRSMGIEMLNMANLDSYFRTEEVKRGLLEFIEQKGADNVSAMEIEILASQLYVEELEDKYGTSEEILNNIKNDLEQSKAETENKFAEIEKQHNSLVGDISDLNDNFTNFKSLVETDKNKIISQFTDLKNESNQKFSQITGDIDGFSETIGSLEKKVETDRMVTTARFTLVENSILGNETSIKEIKKKQSDNYTTLNSKINTVKNTVDGYSSTISTVQQDIKNINGEVVNSKSEINELKRTSTNLTSRISANEKGLEDNKTKFSEIEQSIDGIKTTVADNYDKTMSQIKQEKDSITLSVSQAEKNAIDKAKKYTDSAIKVGVGNITLTAEQINNMGLVKFSDLKNPNDKTIIDGSLIKTGKIYGQNAYNNYNYWNLETGEFKNSYHGSDVVIADGKIQNAGDRYRTIISDGMIKLVDIKNDNVYNRIELKYNMGFVTPFLGANFREWRIKGVQDGITAINHIPTVSSEYARMNLMTFFANIKIPALNSGDIYNTWFYAPNEWEEETLDIKGVEFICITPMNKREIIVNFHSLEYEDNTNKAIRINVSVAPAGNRSVDASNDIKVSVLFITSI